MRVLIKIVKRILWVPIAFVVGVIVLHIVSSNTASNTKDSKFTGPEPVAIQGYSGPQEDPTISPEGAYLFFDSHNDGGLPTYLYWAKRIDYKTFKFMGEVQGVNFPGEMTLRGNYDLDQNFYFVSLKFRSPCGMLVQGRFKDGAVTNIHPVRGICAPPAAPGDLNVTFDVAVSPDGNTLYYSNAVVADTGQPKFSRIAVATKNADGSFTPLPNSDLLLKSVNDMASRVYNGVPTPDGLALFFTPDVFLFGPAIYMATRFSKLEPFGAPERVATMNDDPQFASFTFSEMGGLSADGNDIYFHRVLGKTTSQLYVSQRK